MKSHLPAKILFVIYCAILVWIILTKLSLSISELMALDHARYINFIPFFYENAVNIHLREVLENIIIFIPFGLLLKMQDKSNRNAILYGLLFSFLLEAAQYILAIGRSDITDLITNTAGTAAGVYLYLLLLKLFKRRERIDKVLFILLIAAIIIFAALFIMLSLAN